MLKKLIFTGLLCSFTLLTTAQHLSYNILTDTADTPVEVKRNYDILLSKTSNLKYLNNCNGNSFSPKLSDDSTYIKRLYSLPTQMELVFNSQVKKQIELYATTRRDLVSYMLGEGKYYFPIFEEALDREGLPLELKYLPVIESAMQPLAKSHKGASGLWQFMAATGKMYDLEINSLVDERLDPHKASVAAARFLKDLYTTYKDWNLVIAAYNCGQGNVNKAITRSGGHTDFWAIYNHLPKETRGYVPIFIAATYIMNYFPEHNICPAECPKPLTMDTLGINRTIHIQQVADILDIPVDDIRKYNPQFKTDVIPGDYKEYRLNLPIEKLTAYIENKDKIYAHRRDELLVHRKVAGVDAVVARNTGTLVNHMVKRGETLAGLADTYGVTATQIRLWNGLASSRLSVGRRLKIYKPSKKAVETSTLLADNTPQGDTIVVSRNGLTQKVKVPKTTTSYYKIRRGDSWQGVARKNGVTIADIKKWNNIKNNTLIAGKSLKIIKTTYVEIEEEIKLEEPQLHAVLIDSTYATDIMDNYLKKIIRDENSLPIINISSTDSDEPMRRGLDDSRIIYHKVKIGETITQIASRYNVTKEDIISWNRLSSKIAKPGQRLLIMLPERDEMNENDNGSQITEHNTKTIATN